MGYNDNLKSFYFYLLSQLRRADLTSLQSNKTLSQVRQFNP